MCQGSWSDKAPPNYITKKINPSQAIDFGTLRITPVHKHSDQSGCVHHVNLTETHPLIYIFGTEAINSYTAIWTISERVGFRGIPLPLLKKVHGAMDRDQGKKKSGSGTFGSRGTWKAILLFGLVYWPKLSRSSRVSVGGAGVWNPVHRSTRCGCGETEKSQRHAGSPLKFKAQ